MPEETVQNKQTGPAATKSGREFAAEFHATLKAWSRQNEKRGAIVIIVDENEDVSTTVQGWKMPLAEALATELMDDGPFSEIHTAASLILMEHKRAKP